VQDNHIEEHPVSGGTYTVVWLALLALLATTIIVARSNLLAQYSVLGALAIASLKAILVLFFFMHLKYEGNFLKIMLTLTLCALTILIGMTFIDIWYR